VAPRVWAVVSIAGGSRYVDHVLEAFAWGALGASALLVGALIAYVFSPGRRVIAAVMALGTGC